MSIDLDVSAVTSKEELLTLLAQAFEFPDYYGSNWDAFDECIRDFPPHGMVRITGIDRLANALPREATMLKCCLQSYAAEAPDRRQVVCT